jgi:hypothetical protein
MRGNYCYAVVIHISPLRPLGRNSCLMLTLRKPVCCYFVSIAYICTVGLVSELWDLFHELDLDGNGHLDAQELATALNKVGEYIQQHW